MKKIKIDKMAIPYRFDMGFAGEIFTFELHYNYRFDFFTMDLYKNEQPILLGNKIVYGRRLFSTVESYETRLPKAIILPIDESGQPVEAITWDNFGESVVLLVGELDE